MNIFIQLYEPQLFLYTNDFVINIHILFLKSLFLSSSHAIMNSKNRSKHRRAASDISSDDESTIVNQPIFHYQQRVILIGDSTVGKSSLLRYFCEGRFAEISDPTVGVDFYARIIEIPPAGLRIKLQLWDTAGQEKFRSITRSYYRNSVGVIIVYDITKRDTFEHVAQWLHEARANVGGPDPSQCVFQLIGHKCDLGDAARQVLHEEGEYLAKYHKMKFIETSAITGVNVDDAFVMMARDIHAKLESGQLRLLDGWDGIKCGGGVPRSGDTLSLSDDDPPMDTSSCFNCW